MFLFKVLVKARAGLERFAERFVAQPEGWVSASSQLAYGSQQARTTATFFAYFHAPWMSQSTYRPDFG